MALRYRFIFLLLLISNIAAASAPQHFSVVNGTIKFVADTNVLALTVEGQSNKMNADVTLDGTGADLDLKAINAKADPKTLATGMSLRDRHMRDKVFALNDGTMPEIRFTAEHSACPKPQSRGESVCSVSGQLTLRGVTRPFSVHLKIRDAGNAYGIDANGALTLSAFGIEPPCQLGVCVKDEVKLNFAFQAKQSAGPSGGGAG
jgi:polyisoprenoid-binding protein YceI